MTDPAAPPTAALDKKKSIILGVIGLIVIILIFWKVIPQVGDYGAAFESLKAMGIEFPGKYFEPGKPQE